MMMEMMNMMNDEKMGIKIRFVRIYKIYKDSHHLNVIIYIYIIYNPHSYYFGY